MSIASQDFRDGAATGAGSLAWRLRKLHAWGVRLSPEVIDKMAETIAHDYGGTVFPDNDTP